MAPAAKKASGAAKPKASHASYQDMITDAIVNVCFSSSTCDLLCNAMYLP